MLNTKKHLEVFDNYIFKEEVHIIGAGSIGSKIALELGKLGVSNLHIYDFDIVNDHNFANQVYRPEDIGLPKVEALKNIIEPYNELVTYHNEKVNKDNMFKGIVIFAIDTMEGRETIWKNCIKLKIPVKFCIDTRMGKDIVILHIINPVDMEDIERYEENLYPAKEVIEESACGFSSSVGATSGIASNYAVWCFMNYVLNGKVSQKELVIGLSPNISFIAY